MSSPRRGWIGPISIRFPLNETQKNKILTDAHFSTSTDGLTVEVDMRICQHFCFYYSLNGKLVHDTEDGFTVEVEICAKGCKL